MIKEQKANRLINATSPYLLQHAYNPVDWYEWGSEALERAKQEDKPILVSIGYSACHWCHVMERECFEKESIAAVMNENFICIKVDREERPDIDHLHMDAVHALGVQGGWPLNVFLTPDQKPFFGGTYFSPVVWPQVLRNISTAFREHRDKIEESAEQLIDHLRRSETASFTRTGGEGDARQEMDAMYAKFGAAFDRRNGGMDRAPKFVMPSTWQWLLRYYHLTQNEEALEHLNLTLKKIARGGIYDQIGGGFARYSVDAEWFVPHFEKMLYDNAQLLSLYSEAFALTKDEEYKAVVYETFEWLQREMTSDDGGFYSALDADSEGEEGKFYVWTRRELEHHLRDNAPLFLSYYNVTEEGNWEHGNNILHRTVADEAFITGESLTHNQWDTLLRENRKVLLRERNERVRPGLDDKIITAWNAMTITGLCDAYKAFDDKRFLKAAVLNMRFLENEVMEGTSLLRSFKNRQARIPAFLDDYAALIQAQLKLYEVTFDEYWVRRADAFMRHVMEHFYDPEDRFFFYSAANGEKLLTRKKEIFDNVIPASNSILAWDLYRLGVLLDKPEWKELAAHMTSSLRGVITSEPAFMSHWAIVHAEIRQGLYEISFVGENAEEFRQEFHILFQPFALTMGTRSKSALPLIADKTQAGGKTTAYLCVDRTCRNPVNSVDALLRQLAGQ